MRSRGEDGLYRCTQEARVPQFADIQVGVHPGFVRRGSGFRLCGVCKCRHKLAVFCRCSQWSTGRLVVMFPRMTSRTDADGTVVRYVALANKRARGRAYEGPGGVGEPGS